MPQPLCAPCGICGGWRYDEPLWRLGEQLGADIPVCLYGRARWSGGIGEQLELAPGVPAAGILLVNPGAR